VDAVSSYNEAIPPQLTAGEGDLDPVLVLLKGDLTLSPNTHVRLGT
jgi:hypothetical protein